MLRLGVSAMPPGRRHVLGLVFLPVILCLTGCDLRERAVPRESTAPIVKVGEQGYTRADLEQFFASRLNEFGGSTSTDEARSALLDSFIEEKLLLQQAAQLKIEPSSQALESMRERIVSSGGGNGTDLKKDVDFERGIVESLKIQAYLHEHLFRKLRVSQEECEAYYKEHLDEFVRNDVVHVREILVDSESQAKKVQALLKANRNRNFQELARIYSKAPTAAEGGDLGTFQRGELPDEFDKVIFPLAPGTVSKIVRTQYGYHIFLVEEKILAHQQKLFEVEDQIREKLLLERQREALAGELASLAQRIPIQVDRERLEFKYTGARLAPRGGTIR
jgi:parvulin-like peptidyl-prolyl isomerase